MYLRLCCDGSHLVPQKLKRHPNLEHNTLPFAMSAVSQKYKK